MNDWSRTLPRAEKDARSLLRTWQVGAGEARLNVFFCASAKAAGILGAELLKQGPIMQNERLTTTPLKDGAYDRAPGIGSLSVVKKGAILVLTYSPSAQTNVRSWAQQAMQEAVKAGA